MFNPLRGEGGSPHFEGEGVTRAGPRVPSIAIAMNLG
jgi:hypothetical protein